MQTISPLTQLIQRQIEKEEEEMLQKKQNSGVVERNENVVGRILQHKGNGRPIEPKTREFMESRFGDDFSKVKVHADSQADKLSSWLGAEAFTVGKDVYFKAGKYSPASIQGKKLLAHELTHVVQQSGSISLNSSQKQIQTKKTITITRDVDIGTSSC